jgi:hypothetical protein
MLTRGRDYSFGPWPQPAPDFFEDGAPAVLHVPEDVQKDWDRHVGRRYIKQVLFDTLPSWIWARQNPGLRTVSDQRFCQILCDGIFSKFLMPEALFDAPDLARFAAYLDGTKGPGLGAGEGWYKSDFSPMRLVPSDADSSTVPSVVLFKRRADQAYELVAIALDDNVFDPSHAGWLDHRQVLRAAGRGRHHHALDAPQAALPQQRGGRHHAHAPRARQHAQAAALPHFRLALAVNYAVLYGDQTVLKPGQIYAPYPGSLEQHAEIVATLWRGLDHADGTPNRAYPRYRFPLDAPVIHSPYGTFLGRYHQTLLEFGRKVTRHRRGAAPARRGGVGRPLRRVGPRLPRVAPPSSTTMCSRACSPASRSTWPSRTRPTTSSTGKVDPREVPFRLHTRVPTLEQRDAPTPARWSRCATTSTTRCAR